MSLKVVHVSGPPVVGKTLLARTAAARRGDEPNHFVRLFVENAPDDPPPALGLVIPEMKSSVRRSVRPERVFECVAGEIERIGRSRRRTTVFIETDGHPCFRHAFPYDVKVFVMGRPANLRQVFRSANETAEAVQRAMADTAEFAAEVFGLPLDADGSMAGVDVRSAVAAVGEGGNDAEAFLETAVGAEIALRLRLQPHYHSVTDSDVVLLNESAGAERAAVPDCVAEIEAILAQVRRRLGRAVWFAACHPFDPADPLGLRAIERIDELICAAHGRPR